MALALYTSYGRAGPADWELFEEALRRARMLDEPILLLAVLNKYAWASQHDPAMRDRATELIDEMDTLLEDGRIIPPAAMLDTIAWFRLFQGRLDDADRVRSPPDRPSPMTRPRCSPTWRRCATARDEWTKRHACWRPRASSRCAPAPQPWRSMHCVTSRP
jgi:hypothetical protein